MPEDRTRDPGWTAIERDDPGIYAGFWRRAGAASIDQAIVSVPWTVAILTAGRGAFATHAIAGASISFTIWLLYHTAFEASRLHATPGKRMFGLQVRDEDGEPLGPGGALVRTLLKLLSSLTLGLGFAAAGWTKRRQALHDILAGTIVVRRTPPSEGRGLVVLVAAIALSVASAAVLPHMEPERFVPGYDGATDVGTDPCPEGFVSPEAVGARIPAGFPLPGYTIREVTPGGLQVVMEVDVERNRARDLLEQHFRDAGTEVATSPSIAWVPDTRADHGDRDERTFWFRGHGVPGIWQVTVSGCEGSRSEIYLDAVGV